MTVTLNINETDYKRYDLHDNINFDEIKEKIYEEAELRLRFIEVKNKSANLLTEDQVFDL
ncbi:MAG: hypothetical protein KA885_05595 [Spirochaetes bacterium]|nr:hypothetical protein [Spirochaetota bacterium]